MIVRPLEPDDRAGWDRLWAGYLEFYETDLDPAITETTWTRLLDGAEPMHGLVAVRSGAIVGITHHVFHRSTWSAGWYCYLEDLFTDPAARGAGVARALVDATATAGAEAGATKLYWQTHATNATARRLYDQLAVHAGFLVYERDLPT